MAGLIDPKQGMARPNIARVMNSSRSSALAIARRTLKPFSFISSLTGLLKSETWYGARCGFIQTAWKPGSETWLTTKSELASKRSISSAAGVLPPIRSTSPASSAAASGSGSEIGRIVTLSSLGRSESK